MGTCEGSAGTRDWKVKNAFRVTGCTLLKELRKLWYEQAQWPGDGMESPMNTDVDIYYKRLSYLIWLIHNILVLLDLLIIDSKGHMAWHQYITQYNLILYYYPKFNHNIM